jgi:hypothetical protein
MGIRKVGQQPCLTEGIPSGLLLFISPGPVYIIPIIVFAGKEKYGIRKVDFISMKGGIIELKKGGQGVPEHS